MSLQLNITKKMLERVPQFDMLITQEECDFLPWIRGGREALLMTQALWLRTHLGFAAIPPERWADKWSPPSGQYKNLAVVVQTLKMVPEALRKDSTGIIVGARQEAGSGQWIKFLPVIMEEMGFTGKIDLWDVGLDSKTLHHEGLEFHFHHGYYEGRGAYTWGVDDIYVVGPGQVKRRAQYESFKDFKTQAPFFSHEEGRHFYSSSIEISPSWPWQIGQCPCQRCCLEATCGPKTRSFLVHFDNRCHLGIDRWAQDIEQAWDRGVAYVPDNRTDQALAVIKGRQQGFRSGEGQVIPELGVINIQDGELKGKKQDDVNFIPVTGKGGSLHLDPSLPRKTQEVVVGHKQLFLPEGSYPEFNATSVVQDSHLLYVKKDLPRLSEQITTLGQETKKKYTDVHGRIFFFHRPPEEHEMWCWKEKKLVNTPHLCPQYYTDIHCYEFRGWKTCFQHLDRPSVRDLCPGCDRMITSYHHRCPQGLVIAVTDKGNLIEDLVSLHKGREPTTRYSWVSDFKLQPYEETLEGTRITRPEVLNILLGNTSQFHLQLRDLIQLRGPLTVKQILHYLPHHPKSREAVRHHLSQYSDTFVYDDNAGVYSLAFFPNPIT